MSKETSRLLVAVPAFGDAWLVGMVAVTVFSGFAATFSDRYGLAVFLLVAPLAPVAGVSASYGRDADPSYELVTVAPYSALRLLLLRTAGVLALGAGRSSWDSCCLVLTGWQSRGSPRQLRA